MELTPDVSKIGLIIFDTDGTIVPSLEIVYAAIQKVFNDLGWELKHSPEDINYYIGTPSIEVYRYITPPEHAARWEELRERCRAEYAVLFPKSTQIFPGVKETLVALRQRGYHLALFSNASVHYFNIVLNALDVRDYFDYAECVHENGLDKPELVIKIKEKFNSAAAAIVGDRYHDIDAARATGSLAVGAFYGYGGDEPLKADVTINQFKELLDIFDNRIPVFDRIREEIDKRRKPDKPFVVGITGIDGAGKTTFAIALEKYLLSRHYQTQMIHLDDFHNPQAIRYAGEDEAENYYNRSFNLEELINKLLKPLREKAEYTATLPILNLETDKHDNEKEYHFHPNTIVILEGVFLFRKEPSPYIDYSIFLEIPFAESAWRATVRDRQAVVEKYAVKYLPAQRQYLDLFPPQDHADMIIDNTRWGFPDIVNMR